ncbi:baseplate assembly protein J (GpJ) [Pseudomonas aeruginosa]|nr:baseplate assembly protein J (GpJ) [Pseudomonas aeruginosa]
MTTNFVAIDLSQLPPPHAVEQLDYEQILAERKAYAISLWPEDQQAEIAARLALESEPLTKLLEENAYREMLWRQRVNEAALANMLASAQGADLDQLAANYNVRRLVIRRSVEGATLISVVQRRSRSANTVDLRHNGVLAGVIRPTSNVPRPHAPPTRTPPCPG